MTAVRRSLTRRADTVWDLRRGGCPYWICRRWDISPCIPAMTGWWSLIMERSTISRSFGRSFRTIRFDRGVTRRWYWPPGSSGEARASTGSRECLRSLCMTGRRGSCILSGTGLARSHCITGWTAKIWCLRRSSSRSCSIRGLSEISGRMRSGAICTSSASMSRTRSLRMYIR